MAKIHGSAGPFPEATARKKHVTAMLMVILFVMAFSAALGASATVSYGRPDLIWLATLLVIIVGLLFYLTSRRVNALFDAMLAERRKYMRGGEGEDLVSWLLQDLPDSWHIFNGIQLKDGSDIDHVVVGPGGISVISTKNWRGHFAYVPGQGFQWNGAPRGDLLRQAKAQAMSLRERIVALTEGDPYVQAVLAIPWGFIDAKNPVENVWVLHREDLGRYYENATARLDKAQVDRYVKAVDLIAQMSRELTRGNGPKK